MTQLQKIGAIVAALFAFSLFWYFTVERNKATVGTFLKPSAMKGAAKLPTERVSMPEGVRAIKSGSLKGLKIPEDIKSDPTKHVTATAALPKSRGGYDIISVTDDKGDTEILTTEKPPALFSFEHSGRVGIGAGVDSRAGKSAKVFVEYTPITLLGVTVGVDAQARLHPASPDTPADYYGGVLLFKQF